MSGTGLDDTSSTPNKQNMFTGQLMTNHGNRMRNSMIMQQQNAQVKFINYANADQKKGLHHYSSNPNIIGEQSSNILLENQNKYRNHMNQINQ
jgi:hypothetical protein